jgi:hypothetical protein
MTTFACGCTTSALDYIPDLPWYCNEHYKRGDGPLGEALFDSWFVSLPQPIRDQVNWDGSRWAMELAWRASRSDYTFDRSTQQWLDHTARRGSSLDRDMFLAAIEQLNTSALVDAESGAAVPTKEDTQ